MVDSRRRKPAPKKEVPSPAKRRRTDVSVMGGAGLDKQVRHRGSALG